VPRRVGRQIPVGGDEPARDRPRTVKNAIAAQANPLRRTRCHSPIT